MAGTLHGLRTPICNCAAALAQALGLECLWPGNALDMMQVIATHI